MYGGSYRLYFTDTMIDKNSNLSSRALVFVVKKRKVKNGFGKDLNLYHSLYKMPPLLDLSYLFDFTN
jgi:hypothetical protein